MEATPLTKINMSLEIDETQENLDWKTYQRKLLKRCLCGTAGLIVVAVVLGLLLASVSIEKVCSDKECAKIASEFLSNMDAAVDPCDNFYKFACGKYAANNPIPEDKTQVWGISKISDLLQDQLIEALEEPIGENEAAHFRNLKKYYNSCMNTDRIEEIGLKEVKKILERLGGWPVVEDTNPNIGWESVLYGINAIGLNPGYLMRLYVTTDYKNSTVRILAITTPTSQLGRASLIKGKSDKTIKAYYDFMVETAILFGAEEETAKKEMELALNFEINLANESKSMEDIVANISAMYNLYSIEELEMEFPGIPWSDDIENFTPKSLKIPPETKIVLHEPKYTKSLIKILRDTPTRIIRNYIIWRAIWDMAPFLNKKVRDLEQNFEEVVFGRAKQLQRPKECLKAINDLYITEESALYVRKYFDQHSKTTASELVDYIRKQFKVTLNETKWPEQDKAKAIEKIEGLNAHVGFPNELLDDEKLNSLYRELEITESFLQSSLNLKKFKADFKYNRLFKPVNKTDWIDLSDSAVVNAFYDHKTNAIEIPAAILQGSYFNARRPRYVNFASIGYIIGHEMSHGFDVVGHQFNKDGAIENWWSEVAERDFAEKTRCMVEQYNNFTMFGQTINGNLTVGENVADFGGIKTAYFAYQNWRSHHDEEPGLPGLSYTNNQLFWLAAASTWCNNEKEESVKFGITTDKHAPSEFRVNGAMSNLEMFSNDFSCPKGSNMNPEKKCTPW